MCQHQVNYYTGAPIRRSHGLKAFSAYHDRAVRAGTADEYSLPSMDDSIGLE